MGVTAHPGHDCLRQEMTSVVIRRYLELGPKVKLDNDWYDGNWATQSMGPLSSENMVANSDLARPVGEGFVHQCGGRERVFGTLKTQLSSNQPVALIVDRWEKSSLAPAWPS